MTISLYSGSKPLNTSAHPETSSPTRLRALTPYNGFTLIEMLASLAIAGVLLAGLAGLLGQAAATQGAAAERTDLYRQAHFALQRMSRAVSRSRRLLLPLNDNPATNWPEHIREQTVPASPPIGASTLATAVLALTLPAYQDLDFNGIPDADNDGDGIIDEDLANDASNDGQPGIIGIDDNGDGGVDDSTSGSGDDDEDDSSNEDTVTNNSDGDGDGSIDEDPYADMNYDFMPGVAGVDDDGDGSVDEGGIFASWNDDEDDATNEDWYDPVVFRLSGTQLLERTPVPWDENTDTLIDGNDYIESVIADNVSRFKVERRPLGAGRATLVELTLELTGPDTGQTVSLTTQARIGGRL